MSDTVILEKGKAILYRAFKTGLYPWNHIATKTWLSD